MPRLFTPLLILCALLLACSEPLGALLTWQQGASLWTIWTTHLLHWSGSHLFWDLLVVACCGWQLDRKAPARHLLLWLLVPPLTIAAITLLQPEIGSFRGSSGLASAQFCSLMLISWSEGRQRLLALLGLLAFTGKTIYECSRGGSAFADLQGALPLASSHLMGAGVAITLHLLISRMKSVRPAAALQDDRPVAA